MWNFGEIDEKSPKLNSGQSMRKNENFWKFENFSESASNSECTEIKFSMYESKIIKHVLFLEHLEFLVIEP